MFKTKIQTVDGGFFITLPPEALASLDICEGTELEVSFDGHSIVLQRAGARAELSRILGEVMDEDAEILSELAD